MRNAVLLMLSLMTVGCGTINTVGRDNYDVGSSLIKQGSYCETMPRLYSGVGYNICKMNSKPIDYGTILLGFAVIDSMLSAVTDTVVLPYTLYSQNTYGSFDLRAHIRH